MIDSAHRTRAFPFASASAWAAIALAASLLVAAGTVPSQAPQTQPAAIVPVSRTDEWAIARQDEVLKRVRDAKSPVDVVFLGDSITQGWEGEGAQVWSRDIASLGPALNLGVGGDRTEHVLWRLQQAPLTACDPRAIVVMIGTNNLGHGSSNAAQTARGVQTIIDRLLAQCPNATVVVLGIFPRGREMNAMRGDCCQVNQAVESFVRRHPSKRVEFHDIGSLFVEPDGTIPEAVMPDALHLSPDAYALWAKAVTPRIKEILATPRTSPAVKQ